MKNIALLVGIVGLLSLGTARSEIVFFDSFETPDITAFSTSFSPGWTVSKPDTDSVGLIDGPTAFVPLPAYDGNQAADFNANDSAIGGSISRSITTVIGQEYQVSLYYLSYNSISVGAGAVQLDFGTASTSAVATAADTWTQVTLNFTAVDTSTLLQITDVTTGITNFKDLWVDSVTVSTVPEPTTTVMALAAGVGFLFRRRKICR